MLRKRKSKKMAAGNTDINITSLLDVLTVLLFFLILSANLSSVQMTVPQEIKLPSSGVEQEPQEGIRVALSDQQLLFNNTVVVKLLNGRFPASALGSDGRTILPLRSLLEKEGKKKKDFYKEVEKKDDPTLIPETSLLIQADQKLPFGTLKMLLHTATVAGFADYQFAVKKAQ